MTLIVDQHPLCKKFDWSSIIKPDDNVEAIRIIKEIIESGNYFTNSPPFQTKENVFQRPEEVWMKFRMSFLMSCFLYLGREVKVTGMKAWSFMTNLNTVEDRDRYWHHHSKYGEGNGLSGIWYLKIPDDVKDRQTCGTEMAPNGPEGDGNFFLTPSDFHWMVYPSQIWHRPGIVQSNDWRFIIAVDMQYI